MLTKPVLYDLCVADPISRRGLLRDYEPSDGTFWSTSNLSDSRGSLGSNQLPGHNGHSPASACIQTAAFNKLFSATSGTRRGHASYSLRTWDMNNCQVSTEEALLMSGNLYDCSLDIMSRSHNILHHGMFSLCLYDVLWNIRKSQLKYLFVWRCVVAILMGMKYTCKNSAFSSGHKLQVIIAIIFQ